MAAVKLASSIEGPEDAPVLVLGNPIGTNRDVWSHQLPVLSRYFRVLRYNPRGHGAPGDQSPAPDGPYTIADLGGDVLALADAHGIERFAYAGVSLGGMTGIWLAASRTPTAMLFPTSPRIARMISIRNRIRFSRLPPYSSVRVFRIGDRNWAGR